MSGTSALIKLLAQEAGTKTGFGRADDDFGWRLLLAALIAFAVALGLILLAFGPSIDIGTVLGSYPFYYKAGIMLLLAGGSFSVVRHHSVPGSSGFAALALLPGLVVPFLGAVFDASGFPLLGRDTVSVPICFFSIVATSLPALAIVLWAMKRAVVTEPTMAGVSSGLLAGALGAGAYTVACKNDGALFVLVWYGLAIGAICVVGAVAGRRYLRW
jgi:hypothetical protein